MGPSAGHPSESAACPPASSSSVCLGQPLARPREVEAGAENLPVQTTGAAQVPTSPTPLHDVEPRAGRVGLGGQFVHETHALYQNQGLFYCFTCGCYGSRVLRWLASACRGLPPRRDRNAWNRLTRLRQGRTPREGVPFPCPNEGPPAGPWRA
jgi:hypothetical protein